jgi:hypothetical protein
MGEDDIIIVVLKLYKSWVKQEKFMIVKDNYDFKKVCQRTIVDKYNYMKKSS